MNRLSVLFLALVLGGLSTACASNNASVSHNDALRLARGRDNIHVMQNDVEFGNYNERQQIADDPTTILWCTSAFPIPSSPLFTVPVVGKLTSGGKRPFNYEPGPDGMYGSSGEYRYGFTPAGMYVDFYNLSTFCTDEPTVWQRENTDVVLKLDASLGASHDRAREALDQGNLEEADRILEEAISDINR